MSEETPAAPVAAAPTVAPAAQTTTDPQADPAPVTPPFFGIGVKHIMGGTAIAGSAYGLTELAGLYQPIIHWAVTGGVPTPDAEHAMSVIGALVTIGVAGIIATFTTRRRSA